MATFRLAKESLNGGVWLLRVEGFLDAHTFEKLEAELEGLFDKRQFKVVVDLSKLDYISSAGAGVFIGGIGRAQENEGNIVLLNPTPNVREVFDLLGLSQIFPFADNVKEAVGHFK